MYNTEIRLANTAAPSFQSEVNVSGFGWTGVDQGHYNQLLQYVYECRKIQDDINSKTEIFDKVAAEASNIERAILFVYDSSKEISEAREEIKSIRDSIISDMEKMKIMSANVTLAYNDFIPKYQDFLEKYEEIIGKLP